MSTLALFIQLLALLLVGCLGPGLWIVRKLHWSPLEKLGGAVGASLIATYLVSFGLFCLNAGSWAYWAASAVFALLGCLSWRQAAVLLKRRRSRAAIIALFVVLGWEFLHLSLARQLGGGGWTGDWYEHFDRTRFFMHELPAQFKYLGSYSLPARPPMMNVLAAFYSEQVGLNFEAYSLVFLVLNGLAFLPCCLLLRHFGRRSGRCIPILAILFMLNPSVLQNVTFTWTKALATAFVILGVSFYLSSLKRRDNTRLIAAALSLAAAMLVHYSAGPFVVAVILHDLCMVVVKRRKLSHAITGAAAAATLLATWFVWSTATFGWGTTLKDNTTVSGLSSQSVRQLLIALQYNSFTNIVPHLFHSCPWQWFVPIKSWFDLRDYFFTMYQTNLTVMMGSAGGVIVWITMLAKFIRKGNRHDIDIKDFWLIFLVVSFLLGTAATTSSWEAFGSAHVTLQSLALIGLTFLASQVPGLRPILLGVLVLGLSMDYALGVFLHFDCRSQIFLMPPVEPLSFDAREYSIKMQHGFTFWGDHLAAISGILKLISIAGAAAMVFYLPILTRIVARQIGDGANSRMALGVS